MQLPTNPSRAPIARRFSRLAACALAAVVCCVRAPAQVLSDELPEQAQGVVVDEHLGETVPMDIVLRRSDGTMVSLGDAFDGDKPVVLVMAYYSCPLVCPVIQEKLAQSLAQTDYLIGRDFRLVVVSFDPTNTIEMAADARSRAINAYGHAMTDEIESGFLYHTTSDSEAHRLADAIGYKYRKLPNGEYSHPVSFCVLSPAGAITRYFYGFDYPPREMKLTLLDASNGKIGRSFGDAILHFCFSYDPSAGAYSLQAFRVMQLGAGATVVLLGSLILTLKLKERVRRRRPDPRRPDAPPAPSSTHDLPASDALHTGTTP